MSILEQKKTYLMLSSINFTVIHFYLNRCVKEQSKNNVLGKNKKNRVLLVFSTF